MSRPKKQPPYDHERERTLYALSILEARHATLTAVIDGFRQLQQTARVGAIALSAAKDIIAADAEEQEAKALSVLAALPSGDATR